jgi:L-2-hydroxycarboxylate dehydrogenase (NAD+)
MVLVEVARLREIVLGILVANEVPSPAAALRTETLIAAELCGHSSHGVLRLRRNVERIRDSEPAAGGAPVTVPGDGARTRSERTLDRGVEVSDQVWNDLPALWPARAGSERP